MRTIFVSSTFRDMQAERDAIRDLCAPLINEEARKHGDEVDFCDLRWGINTSSMSEEESSLKVLDVCFNQIDRCQPPFVILSGYRYGWIPDSDIVEKAVHSRHMDLEDLEKSVTALEIEYGTVHCSRPAFVYIREIISDDVPAIYGCEDEYHQKKLQELKERITALPNVKVRTYTVHFEKGIANKEDIKAFAEMLTEDLKEAMRRDWELYDTCTPFERMLKGHWNYVREKAGMFTARKEDAKNLYSLLKEGEKQTVLCTGESGSGKSTLLSWTAQRLEEEGEHVLPVICGLTPETTDAYHVLRMIEEYLCSLTRQPFSQRNKTAEEHQKRIIQLASKIRERVYILVDAADQLYADDNRKDMIFIPDNMPLNVRFLVTCTKDLKTDFPVSMVLEGLNEENRQKVISGVLEYVNKELGSSVQEHIMRHSSASMPLSIALMVQRLCIMNVTDFDVINSSDKEANTAIADRQKTLISMMPDDLPSLSAFVFEEVGKRIDQSFCRKIREYIAVCRYGIRASDLISLCRDSWNSLNFAHYINSLYTDFLVRSDGRWDFMHKSIRQGILSVTDVSAVNREIAVYLGTLDSNDPVRISEYVYHLLKAEMFKELHEYFLEITRSREYEKFRNAAENVFDLVMKEGTEPVKKYIRAVPSFEKTHADFNFLALYMHLPFTSNKQQSVLLCDLLESVCEVLEPSLSEFSKKGAENFYNSVCTSLHRSGIFAEKMDISRKYSLRLLDYWKKNADPDKIEEKAKLFSAHYDALYSLKGSDQETHLLQAEEIGLSAAELLDEELKKYLSSKGDLVYSSLYGSLGEVYTRLNNPAKTEEMYLKDQKLRLETFGKDDTDEGKMIIAGSHLNLINTERTKPQPDLDTEYAHARAAADIFDSIQIPDHNEAQYREWAVRAYTEAAQLYPLVHTDISPDEELIYYTWYVKAMNHLRIAYRKYRQENVIGMSDLIIKPLFSRKSIYEETLQFCRQAAHAWIEEDNPAIKQDPCLENYRLRELSAQFLGVLLTKNPENFREFEQLTAGLASLIEKADLSDPRLRSILLTSYRNLYTFTDDTDTWQKHAYDFALSTGNTAFVRRVLHGIVISAIESHEKYAKLVGFCYSLILWDTFTEQDFNDPEAFGEAGMACINRSTLIHDLRPGDYRFMEYVDEHARLIEKHGHLLEPEALQVSKNINRNQRGVFLQTRVSEQTKRENALKKAIAAYHQHKDKETEAELSRALQTSYLWAAAKDGRLLSRTTEKGQVLRLFANSMDAKIQSYSSSKVLYDTKRITPADLASIQSVTLFALDGEEVMSISELTAILLRNGIHLKDCRGNSSVQKQTSKQSSGLMRKIIESSDNQDLILTKNDPKKVQEAIKAYASHLHLSDVIAFLDTTKKSFFKTTPGGILFTDKAIESSGRHIEYEKISDVEVIENKLVFRYGTGIKISLDCDDKKKTVRNLIAEYQKQKQ
ncbi:MAG: DUF4062 domain-containing protein [Solobacterium sp.]|nr:DUF4062 domain-containing protein [Solobacterium sp.]